MGRLRQLYGASPLHALALAASFAVAGAALVRFVDVGSDAGNLLIWFVGAAVLHDLILLPLYSLLDRVAIRALSRGREQRPSSALNYVRVPAALSGLLFLVDFPLILQLGRSTYHAASGQEPNIYLARWLLISGLLFAGSAIAYAVRLRRSRGPARAGRR